MNNHNEDLLTVDEVAEVLSCHVSQVYKLIKREQLPRMIRFGPKMVRMSRVSLNEYIKQLRIDDVGTKT